MHITSTIWICWMSFVARVMRDASENAPISAGENDRTRSYTSWRRSRATLAAVRDAL